MKLFRKGLLALGAMTIVALSVTSAKAVEKDPIPPRVPSDQIAAAKAVKPALDIKSDDVITAGEDLFMGGGTCFTCHGFEGKGDGPAGFALDPSPRNFTNSEWAKHRSPGELMWILKNGSSGTAMVPFIGTPGAILTEEDGWKLIAFIFSLTD